MKWVTETGAFLLVALAVSGCKAGASKATVNAVEPREALGMVRNDFAVIVDIREEAEVKAGALESAVWMPGSKLKSGDPAFEAFVAGLAKEKQVVLCCASPERVAAAAQLLAERGFRTATSGGYEDWVKAGVPVKRAGQSG